MTALLWLLPALPLAAGGLLAVAGRRLDRAAPAVGFAIAVATLGLACAVAVGRPRVSAPWLPGLPATLAVDGLSAVLAITVAAVTTAVLGYAAAELGSDQARGRFFGLMLVFAAAMLVTVTATSLGVLLMGWEAMGAASYALIGFWWREDHRVRAGTTAFLTTRAGDLGLYLAAGAALAGGGTLALDQLAATATPWPHVVAAGVVAAAFGKSAQLPFSFWLSRAMEGPSPVSALLHSATMVAAGAYLLLRLHPLLAAAGWALPVVAWVGVVTALLLGLVALAQRDLKQLLAASTCSQLGYMVLAVGTGGIASGTSYLLGHAATKSLLFLGTGALLTALGTKSLAALRGAGRAFPRTGAAFALGSLCLAGVPPLSLWVLKEEVLAAALATSPALYAAGLLAAVVTAAYSSRTLVVLLERRPPEAAAGYDAEQRGTRRVTVGMFAPVAALAVPAAALGLLAVPGIAHGWQALLGAPGGHPPTWWGTLVSAVLAVAVSAVVVASMDVRGPARRWLPAGRGSAAVNGWLHRWLDLERAASALVVRPVLALARALAAFDDRGLGALARGAVAGWRGLARVADGGVEVPVGRVVAGLATGARHLGALARRPQTGQLHQYYAQAVAVLVILAATLVIAASLVR